jgi:hypothetical protein
MRLATARSKKSTAEVPVLVDETTTKWINGVTGQTTCDDVIEAIVTRQKVSGRRGKVRRSKQIIFLKKSWAFGYRWYVLLQRSGPRRRAW